MKRLTPADFWGKVKISSSNECWEWTGQLSKKGYGQANYQGKKGVGAHRVAWFLTEGAYPQYPMTLDHLCRNRKCVNPVHLEVVTDKENVLRGFGPPAVNKRKTHCINGHPFSGENLLHYGQGRMCRTCHLATSAANARARRKRRIAKPVLCEGCQSLFVRANTKQRFCTRTCYFSKRQKFAAMISNRI